MIRSASNDFQSAGHNKTVVTTGRPGRQLVVSMEDAEPIFKALAQHYAIRAKWTRLGGFGRYYNGTIGQKIADYVEAYVRQNGVLPRGVHSIQMSFGVGSKHVEFPP